MTFPTCDELARLSRQQTATALAEDEPFWQRYACGYVRDESFSQLNYGYYHPSLIPVLDAEIEAMREINRRGSHFKRWQSEECLELARTDLATLAGVDPEELIITRNASEALNIIIQGLTYEPGSEVICSDQDYTAMNQAWDQQAQRDGFRVRRVAIPLDPVSDDEVVRSFEAEITPRTRLIMVTHLIHLTGQILPVERLCALARAKGIPVLVDAAHSFAQIAFSIRDLGCDYLGASLHKWLGAPLGTGMLYVRRDRISGVRPFYGDTEHAKTDIRKLERLGNRPDSTHIGLREAIRWHQALGTAPKQARLAWLHRRWAEPTRRFARYRVLTPSRSGCFGAIGAVALDGVPALALRDYLLERHALFTTAVNLPTGDALRISPGMPTSAAEIGRLLEGLEAAVQHLG